MPQRQCNYWENKVQLADFEWQGFFSAIAPVENSITTE